MAWSNDSTIILIILILIITYLPLSIYYYQHIIKPNAKLPLYKVRRPNFILLLLIMLLCTAMLRTTLSLIVSIQIIDKEVYDILFQISTYYGSVPLACIRMWLLYYDTKCARKQRKYMLSKYLSSVQSLILHEQASNNAFTQLSFRSVTNKQSMRDTMKSIAARKYSNIWGNYKILLLVTYSIITVLFVSDILVMKYSSLSFRPANLLFVFGCIAFWTIILCLMWGKKCCCCCCRTENKSDKEQREPSLSLAVSFRDDWNLLLEMSLIWAIVVLAILVAVPLVNILSSESMRLLQSFITFIAQTANIFAIFYCPYSILIKLEAAKDEARQSKKPKKQKSLQKILSKKAYFFAFVEHLQHEFCIENLTFLVEVWQFKCEAKYDLTSMDKKDMKKAQLVKERLNKWNKERSVKEHSSSGASRSVADQSLSVINRVTSPRKSLLMHQKFLDALPWCDLPLAESLAMNPKDKWAQCMEIYYKFIGSNSYYAVNVGYQAMDEVHYHFDRLIAYKEQTNEDNEVTEENKIGSEQEFNQVMLNVFDFAVGDVLENLNNSYNRFITTDTYKMITT